MNVQDGLTYRWNDPADSAPAASFAGHVIGAAPEYISHGEIQTGLSEDGKSWVEDLGDRYAIDFAELSDRDLLVARDADGEIVAILIVAFEQSQRRSFAVIEDMAVAPELRGSGVGKTLLEMAQTRIAVRDIDWVFLESGLNNEPAHRFFANAGFEMVSHVFARRLGKA